MTLKSYLTRLIWLCVLPLVLLGGWLGVTHVLDQRDEDRREAEVVLAQLVTAVDHHLAARIGALQVLAAAPLVEDPSHWPDFHRQALGLRASFGGEVILVDREQKILLSTRLPPGDPTPPLGRPAGLAAVPTALVEGEPVVGDLFRGPAEEGWFVGIAVPVQRAAGVPMAVASVVPVSQFVALLAEQPLPEGWRLSVLDSKGALIARRGAPGATGEPAALLDPGIAEGLRFERRPPQARWRVVLEVPRAVYLATLARTAVLMLLAVLGATVMGVLGGRVASQRLARAVRSLADPGRPPATGAEIAEITTARHALEQAALALQVSEARLRGIFESATDAVITVDETQTMVMVNPAAAQMFRCPVSELLGTPLDRLLPPRYRERHRRLVQDFGATGDSSRHMGAVPRLVGLRADGEEFPAEGTISHVHVDGQRLFTVILRDVTARHQAQAELEASHAALRRMVARQDSVQEEERKRIARELHDELQQSLAAVKMDVAAAAAELPRNPAQAARLLARVDELAGAAIASTRRIVNDLRPQLLEDLGLVPALEVLVSQFAHRTAIETTLHAGAGVAEHPRLTPDVATCLYRVAQEALNNVAKHAHARRAQVALDCTAGDALRLRISDDGSGLSVEDWRKPNAYGLLGMTERVRAVGGQLSVQALPEGGTAVEVVVHMAAPGNDAGP